MRKVFAGGLLMLLLSTTGCSLSTLPHLVESILDPGPEPAPLVEFTPEIELVERWHQVIGVGQGETYNRLTPVVYGEQLYVADVEGLVTSIDRFTGESEWTVALDVPISGGVSAGFGLLLVGTLQGEVIALDVSDGEVVWRAQVGSEVLAPPVINGDIVLAQTQDDRVIALEMDSGYKRWSYESPPALLTLRGTSTPVLTNDVAFVAFSSGKVAALTTRRGLPIWEQRVAIPQGRSELERVVDIDGSMLLSGQLLYVVTYQGRLAALDVQTGRMLWQREASSYVGLAEGYGSLYVSLAEGALQGVDERSTSVLWRNDRLNRRQLSAPALISNYVAVGDVEGYLHVLSQIDGRFVARVEVSTSGWKFGPRYGVRVRPLVEGNWMYVYGNKGDLVALELR